jgi:hypothetical protein
VRLLIVLRDEGALTRRAEADTRLHAAGMLPLFVGQPQEEDGVHSTLACPIK